MSVLTPPLPQSKGYLAIVLDAHTPYIRPRRSLAQLYNDEYWLFDHILDSYFPLLDLLERLYAENVPYRLTISLSPTLLEMLDSSRMQERFDRYLEKKISLAVREADRCLFELELSELVDHYLSRLRYYREKFNFVYNRQIISAFAKLANDGCIELITTTATNAILPILYPYAALSRAQIETGINTFKRCFGFKPQGFWLPECAFNPGLEKLLIKSGLQYTYTTACENMGAIPHPGHGAISPLRNVDNFVFFPGDTESELEVWSAKSGYYNDFSYRNCFRDLSDEVPELDLSDFAPVGQDRPQTGFRYFSNGTSTSSKYYNLEQGRSMAQIHAKAFLSSRKRQIERLQNKLEHPPLITLTLNAEFFGCMWYEGYVWLEHIIRLAAADPEIISLVSSAQLLKYRDQFEFAIPNIGSWMDGGFGARWLNSGNDWLIIALSIASRHMYEMAKIGDKNPDMHQAVNQALRELMLAQSADWPLLLSSGQSIQTARRKLRNHLVAFNKLYEDCQNGRVDLESLRNLQERTPLFTDLNYRDFFTKGEFINYGRPQNLTAS
ncbi:MAG: 1,4-alpha-glucan branching protein domain-containing protein [Candidatus Bruticola sp.]